MIIYRIQHSTNGAGPYRNRATPELDCFCSLLANKHRFTAAQPSPCLDLVFANKPELPASSYRFGFASMTDLRNWFGDDLNDLHAHGYLIAVYDSSQVLTGGKQVAFFSKKPLSQFPILAI